MSESAAALRRRAVALLARRDYTRAELLGKLASLGNAKEIDTVLDALQQSGMQSDARTALAWVTSRGVRFGVARMRQELRRRGIASELIEATLQHTASDHVSELEKAQGLVDKKYGSTQIADAREWARRARFLQARGFAADIVRRALKDRGEGDAA